MVEVCAVVFLLWLDCFMSVVGFAEGPVGIYVV